MTNTLFGGDRPHGSLSFRIVGREEYDIGRGAMREALLLECGHVIERKPRPGANRSVVCPECNR